MDNAPFIVVPCVVHGNPRFKLEIKASVAGKKVRRFFPDEQEAYRIGDELTGQIRTHGTASLEATGLTVNGAIKRFWAFRGDKIHGRHEGMMESIFKAFSEKHGARSVNTINAAVLETFWNRKEWPDGKSMRWQAYSYLRILFNWLERHDLVEQNPIRRVDPPTKPKPLSNFLEPEQMEELLKLPHPYLVAFVCLVGFAGFRPSEARRIDIKRDIDWKRKEAKVVDFDKDEKIIGVQRYVELPPAFLRHCPREFEYPNQRNFYKAMRYAVGNTSLGALSQNVLRHTFCTYHLAKSKNAAETAHAAGNSEKMIRETYAKAAPRAQQKAFWGL